MNYAEEIINKIDMKLSVLTTEELIKIYNSKRLGFTEINLTINNNYSVKIIKMVYFFIYEPLIYIKVYKNNKYIENIEDINKKLSKYFDKIFEYYVLEEKNKKEKVYKSILSEI